MLIRRIVPTAVALLALTAAAYAQPSPSPSPMPCNALTDAGGAPLPPPIYITGSTALEPLLKTIGPKIAAQSSNAYTIVYLRDGSCSGATRTYTDGLIKQNMFYLPPTFTDPTKTPPQCTVDPNNPVTGTLALSDVDPVLCPTVPAKPATVTDFPGPVNDMVLVVPSTSSQKAISSEDVYLMFGLGTNGGVSPWLDPTFYFIRPNDSGTRAMIAANGCGMGMSGLVCLGKHDWQGTYLTMSGAKFGSGDVLNAVAAQQNVQPEKTIGILGEDFLDQGNNRTSVKALAFRAYQQQLAYWPDSSLTSRDRKNVRDGHYKIWGYVHMLAQAANGTPSDSKAAYFINLIQGKVAGSGFDTQDAITQAHLTPICAMNVTHDTEGADQKPYTPDAPCGCSFEALATGVATPPGCTPCNNGQCATGVCRKGFCEAK